MSKQSLYKKFLKQRHTQSYHFLNVTWGLVGPVALYCLALFEPWSGQLFAYLFASGISELAVYFAVMPIVMLFKAWFVVESIGYIYHRYAEHLGFLTKLSSQVRKNQRNHWKHHMRDYPIGPIYIRDEKYQRSQSGIPWEWAFPGFLTLGLLIVFVGITIESMMLFGFTALYALMVGKAHQRFHELKNPWAESKYFNWLEDIHVIHHWDQATNYSITIPIYDIIFGTYVSPKKHKEFLKEARQKNKVYTSDLINWHYMMHFAWPRKHAIQVTSIKNDKIQRAKFKLVLADLKREFKKNQSDVLLNVYLNRMETFDSSIIKI